MGQLSTALDNQATQGLISLGSRISQPSQGYAGQTVSVPGATLSPGSDSGNPILAAGFTTSLGNPSTLIFLALGGVAIYLLLKHGR